MDLKIAPQVIEAILFVAGEPVKIAELAKALEIDEKDAIRAVETLERHFEDEKRGITVKRYGDHLRLETRAEYAPYVEKMLSPSSAKA